MQPPERKAPVLVSSYFNARRICEQRWSTRPNLTALRSPIPGTHVGFIPAETAEVAQRVARERIREILAFLGRNDSVLSANHAGNTRDRVLEAGPRHSKIDFIASAGSFRAQSARQGRNN